MLKKMAFILFVGLSIEIGAASYNIGNILQIEIPEEFEIVKIRQIFQEHSKSDQYSWKVIFYVVYDNHCLPLRVYLFGYGDTSEVIEALNYTGEIEDYLAEYSIADQKKYLFRFYEEDRQYNKHGLGYSLFISNWGSGFSSDYAGIFFKMENSKFNEGFIHTYNSWRVLGGTDVNRLSPEFFENTIHEQNDSIKTYFDTFFLVVESITTDVSDGDLIIYDESTDLEKYPFERYEPGISGLQWRSAPDLDSEIIGYVQDDPHIVLEVGEEDTINGVTGTWTRYWNVWTEEIGWTLDAYMEPETIREE